MPRTSTFYPSKNFPIDRFIGLEVLAEYAANFVYKPGHVLSAPDALSRMPALYVIENN